MRKKRIWLGLGGLYLSLLLAVGLFYLLDQDLSTEDKILLTVGVSGLPAVAFVAAAAPLVRGSRDRVALIGGAALAVTAALFQLMVTFGFALPLSVVLIGVAVADANRAAKFNGMRTGRRLVAICAALALLAVNSVIAALVLLGAAAVMTAAALRKRLSRRRPPSARPQN